MTRRTGVSRSGESLRTQRSALKRAERAMTELPLSGVRVLDASNTYAGPTCGRVLADLGAEVIHVEAIQRWETVRLIVLPENEVGDEYWNDGAYFMKRNLGKKGLTLNLTQPDGVTAFRAIAV